MLMTMEMFWNPSLRSTNHSLQTVVPDEGRLRINEPQAFSTFYD